MDSYPEIPERVSSLLSSTTRDALLQHRQRSTSAMSRMSEISQMTSATSVSEFLEAKVVSLQAELEYIKCEKNALDGARSHQHFTESEFVEELEPYLAQFRSKSQELRIAKRQGRTFRADMEEEVQKKHQRTASPEIGLIERAYQTVLVERVTGASAKQKARKFSQSHFRDKVISQYSPNSYPGSDWCHILGQYCYKVKAAHIVPKSLTGDELAHLFGDEESVFDDVRNGITLVSSLEERFDRGVIAIVPVDGKIVHPTRWKCVLLDETKGDDVIYQPHTGENRGPPTRLRDVDGRELKFLTDNRPARRFLYFRFIITYLAAKRSGNLSVQKKVDKTKFWPTLGRYLNNSTLVTLARCVSGCELPDSLIEGQTFEADNEANSEDVGILLSGKFRDAWADSARALDSLNIKTDSDSEEPDTDEEA